MYAIETKNLTVRFGSTAAVDNVSLALEPGRIYGLLGRNGAGKTTLLNVIANKLFPTAGEARVDGQEASENAEAQAKVFYMTEKNLYPPTMRVRQAFYWAREFYTGFDMAYAEGLAKKFGLGTGKKVKTLSTGYTSIFKAVLALSSGAPILLLDEPVLGLDANHRALLYREIIARFGEKPATVVISTHLIDEVAEVLEDVVIIKRGQVIEQSNVEELLRTACAVSGEASAVDGFTAGRHVIASETMGRFKTATMRGALDEPSKAQAREAGLDVTPATLQKLFIDLTNE